MAEKAFTRATDVIDGAHPTRSVLRLLLRRPGRMTVAVLAFALKEIPLWFLPVVTAAIIDIVAEGGDVSAVLGWLASRSCCCCRTIRTTSSRRAAS